MTQKTLNVRMDEEIKKKLDALCKDVGMTTSTAINLFAKAFIREGKLPFEIVASDEYRTKSNKDHPQEDKDTSNEIEELEK